ncbi:MAG: hypothetical protein JWO82_2909, partial [Akkermansiaceae bacterium]|nr:hypothetical protein [Akkermansiaceae bacterium]
GKRGVERILQPNLNAREAEQFHIAANAVKEVMKVLD